MDNNNVREPYIMRTKLTLPIFPSLRFYYWDKQRGKKKEVTGDK
jgi:hypothetical protein